MKPGNTYYTQMILSVWDGKQCLAPEAGCCLDPEMAWFLKTFETSKNDSIGLRLAKNDLGFLNASSLNVLFGRLGENLNLKP